MSPVTFPCILSPPDTQAYFSPKFGQAVETSVYKFLPQRYDEEESAALRLSGGATVSKQIHLTSGPITSQLIRLCLPLLAANVLQQLYNIINSLIVRHFIGGDAFAALGVAESVMNLFIYVITGACMGASVLVARFFGEQNFPRLRRQMFVSGVLIGGTTLVAVILTQLFLPQLLRLISTPEELMADTTDYLRIILVGMLFTFAYNYLAATLRAIGNTKAALYFLLTSLGYNLLAAWVLVAQLKLGIVGTALATSSAQLLSALLCLLYMRKKLPFLRISKADMHLEPMLMRLTTSYAAVAALQQSSLYLGKLMIQSAVNSISTDAISAFTATTRVENFTQAFGISACEAIAIFVAQNQGAKQYRRANRVFLRGFAITTAIGVGFSVLLGLFARPMVALFLGDDLQSIPLGVSYLQLMAWFYFLSFIGHSYVGHYRGIGRMNITFFGTTLQIVVRVIGTYLLVGGMGLDAVALSTGLGWMVIVIFHSTVYLLERRGIGYHLPTEDGELPEQG